MREITSSVAIRRTAQIDAGEIQQIETEEYDRRCLIRSGNFTRGLQLHAILHRIERRFARGVERNEFAIENHAVDLLLR